MYACEVSVVIGTTATATTAAMTATPAREAVIKEVDAAACVGAQRSLHASHG